MADHHVTTFSSRLGWLVVFNAPTFFYNHHKQRGNLYTLHKFPRCIIVFSCASQFSDSKGQRFESCRVHLKGTFLRCVSCHLDHVLSTAPALKKKPMPTLLPCRIPRLRSRPRPPALTGGGRGPIMGPMSLLGGGAPRRNAGGEILLGKCLVCRLQKLPGGRCLAAGRLWRWFCPCCWSRCSASRWEWPIP